MYDLAFLQNWYLVILGDDPLSFPGQFSMFSESQYEVETFTIQELSTLYAPLSN
jgi:hypothetical protein